MFLDHFSAFANYQPVEFVADLPSSFEGAVPRNTHRPRAGGLLPHTVIETEAGFVQARDLKSGDMVFTFDGGSQKVIAVKHSVPRLTPMMHVPAGALGNERAMDLPADQMIALDEATADRLFDVPVVLAKLVSLAGYNGITPAMPQRLARIHITFEEEELIWGEGGMLMHVADTDAEDSAFWTLSLSESRALVASSQDRVLPQPSEIVRNAQESSVLPAWLQQLKIATPFGLAA
ncbi:hypothetical protein GFB49_03455 [Epibacterium sp. SM1979]|uniref:Hedgehog/Intein (Hint) domain-containing protein n=1 Tax=Tritonibacter litoralis TaxID=2662264 RepID=A0A843Y8G6_9RHOB|nr:Hint domain-containing protein [Tritonibacter litoralis]MQQ07500.1 hypothetical protein [Tritonibacter litoralis]